jgi:hypothetical protein
MRTTLILIAATPVVFGLLILVFGLLTSSIFFKFIPNEATPHFPYTAVRQLRLYIELMQQTPGISWTGISMSMGEASGYYTLRDAAPVSRIEGIESVAKIQGTIDGLGQVATLVASVILSESDTPKKIGEVSGEISSKQIAELVHQMLLAYINEKGADEILDEVLEEVTLFLKRFSDVSKPSSS